MSVTEDTWTTETVAAAKAKDAGDPHAWFNSMYYSRAELIAAVTEFGLTEAIHRIISTAIHPDLVEVRAVWLALVLGHQENGSWSEVSLTRLRTLLS